MKQIPLRGMYGVGLYAVVDDGDFDSLSQYKWYARKTKNALYVERQVFLGKIDGIRRAKSIKMHRDILGLDDGTIIVDHKNRDTLDNRRDNLRVCTHSQNNHNKPVMKRSLSGEKNISKIKNKWRVMVSIDKKNHFIGLFYTIEEAKASRDEFRRNKLGQFA